MLLLVGQDLSLIWQTRQVDKSSRDEGLLFPGEELCCLGNMKTRIESMNGVGDCTVIHSHARIFSIREARENHSRARRDALIDDNNDNKHDA